MALHFGGSFDHFWYNCQRLRLLLLSTCALQLFAFIAIFSNFGDIAYGQIAYTRHLSELRIQELRNIAAHMEFSTNPEKSVCTNFYDFVCSRNRPLYSVLGHLPNDTEIIQLMTELQHDSERFEAKQKLNDFFISCNDVKAVEDCYRESFEYFKPLFGFIITKKYIDGTMHEHIDFLDTLHSFIEKANQTENFRYSPITIRLDTLQKKFARPHSYFRVIDIDNEYKSLRIYRESYEHNLRNLELHRKLNSTYEMGTQRKMLDWSLYVFQSRNKPMSYYFPTFNVHLWMALYNSTVRHYESKRLMDIGECLKLPQYVNVLEEARILAIIYLKSFNKAWEDYNNWITASIINTEIFNQENGILNESNMKINNKKIFYTLYAQNFCDFGKELADNIFYLGLKQNSDFNYIYSCGFQTELRIDCV